MNTEEKIAALEKKVEELEKGLAEQKGCALIIVQKLAEYEEIFAKMNKPAEAPKAETAQPEGQTIILSDLN